MTIANVRQLPGIGEVSGDLGDKSLVVEYDPDKTSPDEITESISEVGFTVEGTFTP